MVTLFNTRMWRVLGAAVMIVLVCAVLFGCKPGEEKVDEATARASIGKIPEGGVPGPPSTTQGSAPPLGAAKKK